MVWGVSVTWLLMFERFHLVKTLWVTKIPSLSNNQLWTSLPAFKVTGSKWNVCEVKHACTFTYMIKILDMETGELAEWNFVYTKITFQQKITNIFTHQIWDNRPQIFSSKDLVFFPSILKVKFEVLKSRRLRLPWQFNFNSILLI